MMGSLKRFVRNRAHPEASIAEGYIVKELLTFISMYLTKISTRFNQRSRNHDDVSGEMDDLSVFSMRVPPLGHVKHNSLSPGLVLADEYLKKAHIFILRNCEVDEYLKLYVAEIRDITIHEANICELGDAEINQFPKWFKNHINVLRHNGDVKAMEGLWALANGPFDLTNYYNSCMVNE
ncbi:hypothetical protein OROHE_000087 [Orobanche hederae]